MGDTLVLAAIIGGGATLLASSIAAYAAIRSAQVVAHVNRKVETNHGGTLGEHVEDLVDWAADVNAFLQLHQGSDNDVRAILGLTPVNLPEPQMPKR